MTGQRLAHRPFCSLVADAAEREPVWLLTLVLSRLQASPLGEPLFPSRHAGRSCVGGLVLQVLAQPGPHLFLVLVRMNGHRMMCGGGDHFVLLTRNCERAAAIAREV